MFGVAVGRYSPVHLGHESVINAMRNTCGDSNCLVVIGSSNAPMSRRNFFSYQERKNFLKAVYSTVLELSIVGLPDYANDEQWLLALDDIICAVNHIYLWQVKEEVTFFGGCKEDLRFFIEDGRNVHIVNRFDGVLSPKISASEIRDDLEYGRSIKGKVNDTIIPKVTAQFKTNWEIFNRHNK